MPSILIKNGRIMDPARNADGKGSLLISDGKIAWQGTDEEKPKMKDCDVIDASGMVVCPGFIDMHCHLRQPGFEAKETIASGTKAAAIGGFTTLCSMPNTEPAPDSEGSYQRIAELSRTEGIVRVLPIGCITAGRAGNNPAELAEMASAGAPGFSDDGSPVMNAGVMRRALEYSDLLGLPVIEHCEDTVIAGHGVMNSGKVAAALGVKGIPGAAEELMVARDIALARMTGGWLHIAHASTTESVELVRRAKAEGIRITAEATPHHLTLTEEEMREGDTDAKVNPPLRAEKDRKDLVEGLKDGTIDIIATDHAPHTAEDKAKGLADAPFGISGLETAFGSLMKLVAEGELSLNGLIEKLTDAPARLLGDRYGVLGTLEPGAEGDVVVLDPEREWTVDTSRFASKGKNTPLEGRSLKGKVMVTVSRGNIVYRDDSIEITHRK